MNGKPSFNMQEKAILKVVFEGQRPMSTREIAERSQMSWITARKYISRLIERGWLVLKKRKPMFNYPKIGIKRRLVK